MRFDIMHVLSNRGNTRSWQELLDETRVRVELADELGFNGVWLGEHHFDGEGNDQMPNPLMMLADLAARTRQIRLGIAAIGLPLWHPIRLAEDVAMLDHFSKGRVDVAFSRGILAGEIMNVNPEADRRNEEQSREIFQENLDMCRMAWSQGDWDEGIDGSHFRWQGKRFTVPWPETPWGGKAMKEWEDEKGNLHTVPIIPQPFQTQMPLYSVSQTESGWRHAAANGLGIISSHPTGKKLQNLNAAYDDEAAKHGGRPAHFAKVAPAVREYAIAETEAEARADIYDFVVSRFEVIKRVRGLQAWLDIDEDPNDPKLQAMDGFDLMMERDYLFVGTPDSVSERMIRLNKEKGWTHFLLAVGHAGPAAIERSMRLMSEEVIPRVKAACGDVTVEASA